MKLICGLGNPGEKYRITRHNIGFMICEILSRRHQIPLDRKKFNGYFGTGMIASQKVALLKPTLYMNRSGKSVGAAFQFYKISGDDLIVIHDDLDLETGRIMVKQGGGTAGHKGLKSIVGMIGGDFTRVRFGIARPESQHEDVSDYVLSHFEPTEMAFVAERLEIAADAVEEIVSRGTLTAMNKFNVRNL